MCSKVDGTIAIKLKVLGLMAYWYTGSAFHQIPQSYLCMHLGNSTKGACIVFAPTSHVESALGLWKSKRIITRRR